MTKVRRPHNICATGGALHMGSKLMIKDREGRIEPLSVAALSQPGMRRSFTVDRYLADAPSVWRLQASTQETLGNPYRQNLPPPPGLERPLPQSLLLIGIAQVLWQDATFRGRFVVVQKPEWETVHPSPRLMRCSNAKRGPGSLDLMPPAEAVCVTYFEAELKKSRACKWLRL